MKLSEMESEAAEPVASKARFCAMDSPSFLFWGLSGLAKRRPVTGAMRKLSSATQRSPRRGLVCLISQMLAENGSVRPDFLSRAPVSEETRRLPPSLRSLHTDRRPLSLGLAPSTKTRTGPLQSAGLAVKDGRSRSPLLSPACDCESRTENGGRSWVSWCVYPSEERDR